MKVIRVGLLLATLAATTPAQNNADWDAGVAHYNQKQYRQAISAFSRVIEANPDFANSYYFIGMSHFLIKEYDRAILHLNRYIQLCEKEKKRPDVKARAALGRAYLFKEDFEKAVTVLTVVTQAVPDEALNFYYLGVAQQKLQRPDKAIEAYGAALRLNPKDAVTLDQLTRLLLSRAASTGAKGDYQQAITRAEQLRLVRDDADSAYLLGSGYLGAGEFQKAAVHLGKAAEARPDDGSLWFNYGLALSRSNQFPRAETALTRASGLLPTNAAVWAELGYVRESQSKYAEAVEAYQKAYEISPSPELQQAIDRARQSSGG